MCVGVVTLLWLAVARRDPYGVSKKTIDLTAIQLNKELSEKVDIYKVHLEAKIYMFIHLSGYLLSYCKSGIVCEPDDTTDPSMVGVVSCPTNTDVGMYCVIMFMSSLWIM